MVKLDPSVLAQSTESPAKDTVFTLACSTPDLPEGLFQVNGSTWLEQLSAWRL